MTKSEINRTDSPAQTATGRTVGAAWPRDFGWPMPMAIRRAVVALALLLTLVCAAQAAAQSLTFGITAVNGTTIGPGDSGNARIRRFVVIYSAPGLGLASCGLRMSTSFTGTPPAPFSVHLARSATGIGTQTGLFPGLRGAVTTDAGAVNGACFSANMNFTCLDLTALPLALSGGQVIGNMYAFEFVADDNASGSATITVLADPDQSGYRFSYYFPGEPVPRLSTSANTVSVTIAISATAVACCDSSRQCTIALSVASCTGAGGVVVAGATCTPTSCCDVGGVVGIPMISQHPATPVVSCVGTSAPFSVTASGGGGPASGPFTYQWQWQPAGAGGGAWVNLTAGDNADAGGMLVVNAASVESATLQIRPLIGYINFAPRAFRCVVTNACGSVTSNEATLSAQTTIACARAAPLGQPYTVTNVHVANAIDLINASPQVSITIEDSTGAMAIFDANGTVIPNLLAAIAGPGGTGNVLSSVTGTTFSYNGLFEFNPVQSYASGNRYEAPTLTTVTAADFANQSPTAEALESRVIRINNYVFSQTGPFTVNDYVNGGVITRVNTVALSNQFNAALGGIPTGRLVQMTGVFGQRDNAPFDSGYLLQITSIVACPTISQQPGNATTCPSGTATFSVTASGTGPFTYQWQHEFPVGTWFDIDEGVNIGMGTAVGIAAPALTLSNIGPIALGRYRVFVANACGSVMSNEATLTICAADFNCSGAISVQDIFDFLNAYFSNDANADFNASGAISVQDIFDFLAAYFAGC